MLTYHLLFTGSGMEPHWRVWAAEIVRKKRLIQRLKTADTFSQLKSTLAFASFGNIYLYLYYQLI